MAAPMRIVNALPPLFDKIDAKFGIVGKDVIFAWGGSIYNPRGVPVTTPLMVHERIHSDRQEHLGGPEKWWLRYIEDDEFRLREEVAAHIGEYQTHLRLVGDSSGNRQKYGLSTALRMCSPVYRWPRTVGFLTVKRAKALIQQREVIDDVDFKLLIERDSAVASGAMVQ